MKFDQEYFNLGYIDTLSYKDTLIHKIDARAKALVVFFFIIAVLSFPKYEIEMLFPFFIFPVLFLSLGDIPLKFVLNRILLVSPFVFFIGIFNPIFDREVAFYFYSFPVTYGMLSFISILIRFVLTISILILLVATTSFSGICRALKSFKVPEIFVNQLLFLYRYIFVLIEEAMRMVRAKELRSFGKKGSELRFYIKLIGTLLFRTIERAERIYYAMLSRGYSGAMPYKKKESFGIKEILFLFVSACLLVFFRFNNVPLFFKKFF